MDAQMRRLQAKLDRYSRPRVAAVRKPSRIPDIGPRLSTALSLPREHSARLSSISTDRSGSSERSGNPYSSASPAATGSPPLAAAPVLGPRQAPSPAWDSCPAALALSPARPAPPLREPLRRRGAGRSTDADPPPPCPAAAPARHAQSPPGSAAGEHSPASAGSPQQRPGTDAGENLRIAVRAIHARTPFALEALYHVTLAAPGGRGGHPALCFAAEEALGLDLSAASSLRRTRQRPAPPVIARRTAPGPASGCWGPMWTRKNASWAPRRHRRRRRMGPGKYGGGGLRSTPTSSPPLSARPPARTPQGEPPPPPDAPYTPASCAPPPVRTPPYTPEPVPVSAPVFCSPACGGGATREAQLRSLLTAASVHVTSQTLWPDELRSAPRPRSQHPPPHQRGPRAATGTPHAAGMVLRRAGAGTRPRSAPPRREGPPHRGPLRAAGAAGGSARSAALQKRVDELQRLSATREKGYATQRLAATREKGYATLWFPRPPSSPMQLEPAPPGAAPRAARSGTGSPAAPAAAGTLAPFPRPASAPPPRAAPQPVAHCVPGLAHLRHSQ
eukprot:TRINITY_DN3379_c0_g1_i3.p1 TRINITY_DN3379_c0_g1~~TRINITY_DN3379_c0_g1_i3.p1  ORF type:complete len:588 (+),score=83.54 TRINITY_DN3379_c0_g1_i3:87-1766(+)